MPARPTSISVHFGALPDPRVERTKAHLLIDILTIGLCAILCGGEGWTDMATFGRARESWLRTFLALPNGILSHDTFGRVFAALDPAAFEAAFAGRVRAVEPKVAARTLALDGKTLRRSHDRAKGKAALHLVSAWADASGLVLGQVAIADKANEIVAIPHLLALLALDGCTVTIDAIASALQRREGDAQRPRAAGDPQRVSRHRPGGARLPRRGGPVGGAARRRAGGGRAAYRGRARSSSATTCSARRSTPRPPANKMRSTCGRSPVS